MISPTPLSKDLRGYNFNLLIRFDKFNLVASKSLLNFKRFNLWYFAILYEYLIFSNIPNWNYFIVILNCIDQTVRIKLHIWIIFLLGRNVKTILQFQTVSYFWQFIKLVSLCIYLSIQNCIGSNINVWRPHQFLNIFNYFLPDFSNFFFDLIVFKIFQTF